MKNYARNVAVILLVTGVVSAVIVAVTLVAPEFLGARGRCLLFVMGIFAVGMCTLHILRYMVWWWVMTGLSQIPERQRPRETGVQAREATLPFSIFTAGLAVFSLVEFFEGNCIDFLIVFTMTEVLLALTALLLWNAEWEVGGE